MKYLMLILIAFAAAHADAQVAFGGKNNKNALIVGDFAQGDLTGPDMFGIERYGIGTGHLEINDYPKMIAENKGGFLLGKGKWRMGLELGAGMVSYQNRPDYMWNPAVSIGAKANLGVMAFYIGPRVGASYSKSRNDLLSGHVIATQFSFMQMTYWRNDYYNQDGSEETLDIIVQDTYNVQMVKDTDKGETVSVGIKLEL